MPPPPRNPTATSARLRVVLAHDCPAARQALRSALQREPRLEVVGEAEKSGDAINLFFKFLPDVVVVSAGLSGQGGFEVLRCIKRGFAQCVVILVSRSSDPFVADVGRALGAAGVCPAADQPGRIVEMLREVASTRCGTEA